MNPTNNQVDFANIVNPAAAGGEVPHLNDMIHMQSYQDISGKVMRMLATWVYEEHYTNFRRDVRYIYLTPEVEKNLPDSKLEKDALYIPMRIADIKINRELSNYVEYLTSTRKQATFRCVEDSTFPCDVVEGEFTRVSRFPGWEEPYLKCIDGVITHGWASIETVYDPSKPGKFANNYLPHDRLMFSLDTEDIQAQELLVIKVFMTAIELRRTIDDFGWSAEQVDKLVSGTPNIADNSRNAQIEIHKVYFKNPDTGIVMIAWGQFNKLSDWLKAPVELYIGIDEQVEVMIPQPPLTSVDPMTGLPTQIPQPPIPSTKWQPKPQKLYPIEVVKYTINEDPRISEIRGRVFKDQPIQDACTSLMSSYTTGMRRSTNVYWCRDKTQSDGPLNIENVRLENGNVVTEPIKQFQLSAPDPMCLTNIQALISQAMTETSQVNYTTFSKRDATATEMDKSTQEAAKLTGSQLILFANSLRNIFNRHWLIFRSQAEQGAVMTSEAFTRAIQGRHFEVFPSGNEEVVRRQEKIQRMMQAWPVIGNVPGLNQKFLQYYVAYAFPEEADQLIAAMNAGAQQQGITQALSQVIQGLIADIQSGTAQQSIQQEMPRIQQLLQVASNAGSTAQPTGAPKPMNQNEPESAAEPTQGSPTPGNQSNPGGLA